MEQVERIRRAMAVRIAEEWDYQPDIDAVDEELENYLESIYQALRQGYHVGFVEALADLERDVVTVHPERPRHWYIPEGMQLDEEGLKAQAAYILAESIEEWGNASLDLAWLRSERGGLRVVKLPFRPDVEIAD